MLQTRILIVDDDADIVTIFKRALSNYSVMGLSDPKTALSILKDNTEDFAILISDIRMPGMSGFELAREAKKHNPHILIALISAFEIKPSEFNSVFPTNRIDATLTKPISIIQLQTTITNLIAKIRPAGESS